MAKPSKAVMAFMEKYGVESDEIWEVHGTTWCVKHKALERIAAEVGVVWEKPELKVCDMAAGFVSVLVGGKLGDHVEFSCHIGDQVMVQGRLMVRRQPS